MVLFNYSTKELTAKIVYYGPGLCGKTTNLEFIYESLPEDKRGRMLSLSTQTDRTLYFDFLPVELGDIRGMKTRVQLYTVPGQVFYDETRRLVLKGVDGIVFVADSQTRMSDANIESFRNLEENLKVHGLQLQDLPMVLQFNKRDLPDIRSVEEMNADLNRYNAPFYEVIATTGIGVHDTLKAISKLVLRALTQRYENAEAPAATPMEDEPRINTESDPEVRPVQEETVTPLMSGGVTDATDAPAAPADAQEWEASELESELDQMDANEIQGLLEEVDSFDTENDEAFMEPAAASPDAFAAGTDAPPSSPDLDHEEGDLFVTPAAGPEEEHAEDFLAEAGQAPEDPREPAAEATGSDVSEEEPTSALSPESHEPASPAPGMATDEEGDHSVWLGAPEEEQDGSLPEDFALPPVEEEAQELSFESFLEQNQEAPDHEDLTDAEPAAAHRPVAAAPVTDAPQDTVTAVPESGDRPVLRPGEPVHEGNGNLRVPLRLKVGDQEHTYILSLSLQPQSDDTV